MKTICQAITNKGTPCKTPALTGETLCLFHSKSPQANELRARGKRTQRLMFGHVKIKDQTDVVSFLEKYMEAVGNAGISITPQMTKSLADLVNSYVSLNQLGMEQKAIEDSLKDKE